MNEVSHEPSSDGKFDLAKLESVPNVLLGIGVVGIIATLVWSRSDPQQFAFSWLFGFVYFFTLCCGSLFWILLHHAVDADWSVIVRRILENVVALFPYLLLLFIPIIIAAPNLYQWMNFHPGQDILLDHKAAYLNKPFFFTRVVVYFTFFLAASFLMRKFSTEQDATGNAYLTLRMRKLSYAFIPMFAGCLTFSAFDWLMGLDYHWSSTMWGVYIFAGSALSSMALLILISNALHAKGYLKYMTVEHNHIMGKLLFTFVVFWSYIGFSQYFLIYYSNIPEETWFYIYRNSGCWNDVSIFLVLGHLVAFILLLTQPAKRNPKRLCFAASWILFMHMVDLYWIIMPQKQINALKHGDIHTVLKFAPHPLDLIVLVSFAAFLAYFFLRALPKNFLYPVRDARLFESIHLKN